MSSRGRWIVRVLMVGFGLFQAAMAVSWAFQSASELTPAMAESTRLLIQTAVAGHLLVAVGWVGLWVSLALGFRDWDTYFHPQTANTGLPKGFRALRRARRQIDGVVPYQDEDVATLRLVAKRRTALGRVTPTSWIGVVSGMVFFAGAVLGPPDPHFGPTLDMVFEVAFRIFAGVMLVVLMVATVKSWRTRTDAKAEAFLRRTQPA